MCNGGLCQIEDELLELSDVSLNEFGLLIS